MDKIQASFQRRKNLKNSPILASLCALLLMTSLASSFFKNPEEEIIFTDPEKLVRGLYASVTFEPGTVPNWENVGRFFIPEVIFAVRQTRTSMAVLDWDGFVAWWESDIERHKMKEKGFVESVEKMKMTIYGNIAQVFVVYKARFMTPDNLPGQLGLDSFSLMKKDGRWWIVSLANDVITPDNPLPDDLQIK